MSLPEPYWTKREAIEKAEAEYRRTGVCPPLDGIGRSHKHLCVACNEVLNEGDIGDCTADVDHLGGLCRRCVENGIKV